jgi:hypothetical protein
MKDIERDCFMEEEEKTEYTEHCRKLLKSMKIDLTGNKRLTKKYNIVEIL